MDTPGEFPDDDRHHCKYRVRLIAAGAEVTRLRDERDAALAGQAVLQQTWLEIRQKLESHAPPGPTFEDSELHLLAVAALTPMAAADWLKRHRDILAVCKQARDRLRFAYERTDAPFCGGMPPEEKQLLEQLDAALAAARAVQGVT